MNPTYLLEAVIYGAKHKILINDIPASIDLTGQPLNSEISINEFLIDNLSEFTVELFPPVDNETLLKRTELQVVIKKVIVQNENLESIQIFKHVKDIDAMTDLPSYRYSEKFNVDIDSRRPPWLDNIFIDAQSTSTIEKFISAFQNIRTLFLNKQVDQILNLYDNKFKYFERCYYLESGNRNKVTRDKLLSTFDDSSFIIAPFNLSILHPNLFAYGKLITLLDKQGYNYIMFYSYEKRILVEFPVYLGETSDNTISVFL